jgi:hypothetical protein
MPSKSKNPVKIGDVFGRLTVLEKQMANLKCKRSPKGYVLQSVSICHCICGNILTAIDRLLKKREKLSCGCLHKENSAKRMHKLAVTHNMSKTGIYKIWSNMHTRCYNKNRKAYKNYGGRGIIVCQKWHTFEGFYEDMVFTYQKGLSIERIDNNGNYCKENCKWISLDQQAKNTRQVNEYFYENKWWILGNLKTHLNCKRDKIRRMELPTRKKYSENSEHN